VSLDVLVLLIVRCSSTMHTTKCFIVTAAT